MSASDCAPASQSISHRRSRELSLNRTLYVAEAAVARADSLGRLAGDIRGLAVDEHARDYPRTFLRYGNQSSHTLVNCAWTQHVQGVGAASVSRLFLGVHALESFDQKLVLEL